jgi:hypothetical protein
MEWHMAHLETITGAKVGWDHDWLQITIVPVGIVNAMQQFAYSTQQPPYPFREDEARVPYCSFTINGA